MEDLAKYALRQCKDASYAEVRCEEHKDQGFILKNGIPEISGFQNVSGISIRILHNGAMGFAATNKMEKPAIKEMISKALKMAKAASKYNKNRIKISAEKIIILRNKVKPKKDPEDIDPGTKLNILKDYDKNLISQKANISSRQFALEHSNVKSWFYNTESSKIFSQVPRVEFFWFMTLDHKQKSKQRYMLYNGIGGLELLKKWQIKKELTSEVKSIQNNLKNSKKTPKGVMDFILGPELTGIASHESIGHPFESDRIFGRESAQAGESFVSPEMLGNKLGNELVTIHDNPLLENTAGYYKYDSEGVRAKDRILIKNGKINDFLHSRETAATLGIKSNGAARANSFDKEPLIRMSNTYVDKGDWKHDEIIKETKKGILMNTYMEWNIDDKRFNQKYTGCDAYYIKNGKIMYPVDNPVLEVATPKLWNSIDAVAKDNFRLYAGPCGKGEPMQSIPVTMGGPTIRIKNIKIK